MIETIACILTPLSIVALGTAVLIYVVSIRRRLRLMYRAVEVMQHNLAARRTTILERHKTSFYETPRVTAHLTALEFADLKRFPGVRFDLAKYAKSMDVELTKNPTDANTCICSFALGEKYQNVYAKCLDSHAEYAKLHGYDYCTIKDWPYYFDRPAAWVKIPLILRLLEMGYSRVLYLDADTLITNPSIPVDPFFSRLEDSGRALLVAEDGAHINTGVLFVRNAWTARAILDLTWGNTLYKDDPNWEQTALIAIMNEVQAVRDHILIEDDNPRLFNSFPVERSWAHRVWPPNTWADGDFICHFSGLRADDDRLTGLITSYDLSSRRNHPRLARIRS